ncbi:MAG: sensor histidine kinase, partial [Hyphomicrobiaceae bacterium]
VTLFQMGSTGTKFKMDLPEDDVIVSYDRRLIAQAMTNLVKNAAESVQAFAETDDAPEDYKGLVVVSLACRDGRAVVEVLDNGAGLSKQHRSRLLEPYVTTKAKGTGLGLAIVQKVMEQHGGSLTLEDAATADAATHGALVRVTLPLTEDGPQAKTEPALEHNL